MGTPDRAPAGPSTRPATDAAAPAGQGAGASPATPAARGPLRIDAVLNHAGEPGRYAPGGRFKVIGSGFGEFAEVPGDAGLYLLPALRGRMIQVFGILRWSDSEIEGVWPAGPVGPQQLILETRDPDGTGRSITLAEVLVP